MRVLVFSAVLLLGCGAPLAPDGGVDAGGLDAGHDGGADAGVDAGLDAGTDGGVDAGVAVLHALSADELHTLLTNKNFLLIDVHTPAANHVPGTDVRIAYDDTAGLVAYIGADLDRKVVLTCVSGSMSGVAGAALVALGYRNIWHLTGGTSAWRAAGYPLVP